MNVPAPKPPQGHKCPKCGTFHQWPTYVFARWSELLTLACECGQKVDIYEGHAGPVYEKTKGS